MAMILPARTSEDVELARALMQEYVRSLPVDIGHERFPEECAALPGAYAPPRGELLLVIAGRRAVGCAALRPLEGDAAEMKRVYLQPEFRGRGLGRRLVEAIVASARRIGYRRIRLDSVRDLRAALALYRSIGFRFILPYREIPTEGAVFMELDLATTTSASRG